MRFVARDRGVQFLPQDSEFVLQVNEEHVCVAGGSPRVTAHAGVAIVPVEYLLLCPEVVAIGPAHGVESGGVFGVPEMDADGLIGAIHRSRCLPRDGGMVVGGIAVEAAVPASLKAHVWIIHRLQVEVVNRSRSPDIGGVIIDGFHDGIVDVDVEYMPLLEH